MADVLFEVEDELLAKLDRIARSKGLDIETYVRELIVAEAQRGIDDENSA